MAQVVSLEKARADTFRDKGGNRRTPFLNSTPESPDRPLAFLMEYEPSYVTHPHLHLCDQWQVIIGGDGKLGRRDAAPYAIHYTRACTPYGPVVGGDKNGIAFFVLFPCYQPGAQYLPAARAILDSMPNRRPWQITRNVDFPELPPGSTVSITQVPEVEDAHGMYAKSVVMAADAEATAPDPSGGRGQYIVVTKGSLNHDGSELPAPTLVYVSPREAPFSLRSGKDGLEAIVLNFSGESPDVPDQHIRDMTLSRWQCDLCQFTYDERDGMPDDGLAPKTRWRDIPDDWACPHCSSPKKDFRQI